jgi:hypothetical protein
LSSSAGAGYVDLMKASIAHGIRPSALVLGKDSGKKWSRTDIVLAKAYQRFLNELCQQCGGPKYLCHTSDNRVQYKIARDECSASAVAEREQRNVGKQDNPPTGVRIYAEPYLTEDAVAEGLEFSDFRRPYLVERAKAMGYLAENYVD